MSLIISFSHQVTLIIITSSISTIISVMFMSSWDAFIMEMGKINHKKWFQWWETDENRSDEKAVDSWLEVMPMKGILVRGDDWRIWTAPFFEKKKGSNAFDLWTWHGVLRKKEISQVGAF